MIRPILYTCATAYLPSVEPLFRLRLHEFRQRHCWGQLRPKVGFLIAVYWQIQLTDQGYFEHLAVFDFIRILDAVGFNNFRKGYPVMV